MSLSLWFNHNPCCIPWSPLPNPVAPSSTVPGRLCGAWPRPRTTGGLPGLGAMDVFFRIQNRLNHFDPQEINFKGSGAVHKTCQGQTYIVGLFFINQLEPRDGTDQEPLGVCNTRRTVTPSEALLLELGNSCSCWRGTGWDETLTSAIFSETEVSSSSHDKWQKRDGKWWNTP